MKMNGLKKVLLAFSILLVTASCGILPGISDAIERIREGPILPALPEAPELPQIDILPPEEPAQDVDASNPFALEQVYMNLFDRASPSVVNIRVVTDRPGVTLPEIEELPDFPFEGEIIPDQAQGSGFVFDDQGHIVTNHHVVVDATRIIVTYADGSEALAELVGTDPDSELAVIRVDTDPALLTPLPLGDSTRVRVGQIVVAIGNPFGLQNSFTTGVVSGLGRMLPTGVVTGGGRYSIPNIIQTDAAINPGNSGGPLLNLRGEVIGINTAITSATGISAGVGYAVPASIVARVAPELIRAGRVQHPWLGISGGNLTADLAEAMNLDRQQRGVLINTVVPGGPAQAAGLQPSTRPVTIDGLQAEVGGDVIVAINDQPVRVFDDLLGYIFAANVGDTVILTILRDGQQQTVEATLEARPRQ